MTLVARYVDMALVRGRAMLTYLTTAVWYRLQYVHLSSKFHTVLVRSNCYTIIHFGAMWCTGIGTCHLHASSTHVVWLLQYWLPKIAIRQTTRPHVHLKGILHPTDRLTLFKVCCWGAWQTFIVQWDDMHVHKDGCTPGETPVRTSVQKV